MLRSAHCHAKRAALAIMTPPISLPMDPSRLPSDEQIAAFYRSWFEANYCTPPGTKASAAIVQAIRAALEHFGPDLGEPQ